jgi:uncharacterized protein YqjF (DUF2071 family)
MNQAKRIIKDIAHRPWDLPQGKWTYYQEWNRTLFLHWKIPTDILQPFVPRGLVLDKFDNKTWVSLVAFTMEKIRPSGLPSIPAISDFHELNLRTYATLEGKPGVYFLHLFAQRYFSGWLAKMLSGLPYEKSEIRRTHDDARQIYSVFNAKRAFKLNAEFIVGNGIEFKSALDNWLTERYCLYFDQANNLFRYEIQHSEWMLKHINLKRLTLDSRLQHFPFERMPDLTHYSEGVKVLAWPRRLVKSDLS